MMVNWLILQNLLYAVIYPHFLGVGCIQLEENSLLRTNLQRSCLTVGAKASNFLLDLASFIESSNFFHSYKIVKSCTDC